MEYRLDRYGNKLSALGFGCMRFQRKGTGIDYEEAEREILRAVELGVNYYDTAYIYPGSEAILGRIISANPGLREKMNLATKLPQYIVRSLKQADKIFQEELDRLQTDHIDYYLMHMFTDIAEWENLKALGIEDWIREKKASGQIRQIGFSFHGNTEMFQKILAAYDWEFCQIQYNYLDEHSQAGRAGLQAAAAKGIPVIIMEPLRGGKLVNLLPKEAEKSIAENARGWSAAEWAFRWLWDQPEVTVVLSGMNSMEMLEENIRSASEARANSFDDGDRALIANVRDAINRNMLVGCTGCRYCMPCPQGVDIPSTFFYYNMTAVTGKSKARHEYLQVVGLRKESSFPSQCIGCGKCEKHCPQAIEIRKHLKEADKALLPLPYKIGLKVATKIVMK